MALGQGMFFPSGDGIDPVEVDAVFHEEGANIVGSAHSQSHVVAGSGSFICVPFYDQIDGRVLL